VVIMDFVFELVLLSKKRRGEIELL